MRKIILFDLDSTLLQMDQNLFIKEYFSLVADKAEALGYPVEDFMKSFTKAAYAIVGNDGSKTNEALFWEIMRLGYPDIGILKEEFQKFYKEEFPRLSYLVRKNDIPRNIIDELKRKGYTLILATNPLFPKECTYERIRWAGLAPADFAYITTYENSCYCKPNHAYFEEIFQKLALPIQGSYMVGNDVSDDFSDLPAGIQGILITDYLINTKHLSIDRPSFSLSSFLEYIRECW